ncbi:MAG: hypothetical protein U9Q20_07065 [Campylobacterota bacterium]|nr:hypothetical protein [Campylobacterota bacterium]
MKYNNLSDTEKKEMQSYVMECAKSIGGKNHFLKMIEDIKEVKQFPLTNKTGKFHFKTGTISWGKEIYQDKIDTLKSLTRILKTDNLFDCDNPKLKKEINNLIKTLGKLEFTVKPNDEKDGLGFNFKPFNTISENNVEFYPIFQIIFLDSINNTKRILTNY